MGCNKSLYWIKAIYYGNISIYGADTVADGTLPLISFPANKKAQSWRLALLPDTKYLFNIVLHVDRSLGWYI